MKKTLAAACLLCSSFPAFSRAETVIPNTAQPQKDATRRIELDFPLVDAPFNFNGGLRGPSMAQSLAASVDFHEVLHYAVDTEKPSFARRFLSAGMDILTFYLPFGSAWLHEEWHRAILSQRRISSHNDVYDFNLFSEAIAVSHIRDEDLIQLKKNHPAEQVRLQSAGIEAEYEFNLALEKRLFYDNSPTQSGVILWFNYLSASLYLFASASSDADTFTDRQNTDDGRNIEKRDFTGMDFTGWSYDLHRPREPYEARGIHPSGIGINRYRKFSDLSEQEQNFLKLQARLSLLNFADPFLIRKRYLGTSPEWNTTLRHHLTSFGYAIDANFFFKNPEWNLFSTLHNYHNGARYFPGLELEFLRKPLDLFGTPFLFGSRLLAWFQPKDQDFYTHDATPGGLLASRLTYPWSPHMEPYVEFEAKSEGWVAGNPYLDPNFTARVGFTATLK